MKRALLAVILAAAAASSSNAQQPVVPDDRAKITVTGEALVTARPDNILITFGIETKDPDIIAAKKKNADILARALAAIRELGVPDKNIQTDYLAVEPRYKDEYRRDDFIGYFAQNTFVVTLAQPEKVDALVTRVLQAGVNYIHGVDFQTTEFRKYRDQARELALKAAKEKAEKMAGTLGRSIGAPLQISESYSGSPYFSSWSWWGGLRRDSMSQNVVQNIQPGGGDTSEPTALGKVAIRGNVTVTFELTK